MRRFLHQPLLIPALAGLLVLPSCVPPVPPTPALAQAPRGIVLMIGDGMGFSQITLARQMLRQGERWTFETLPTVGLVATLSASNATTDSGAAATAMAAGIKTTNNQIGTSVSGEDAPTLAEAAIAAGWRVGYVTTTTISHATPAAFYAHVQDRYDDEPDIAIQLLDHPATIALGGGRDAFLSEQDGGRRVDGRDLLVEAEESGWTLWGPDDDLSAPIPDRLLGLFAHHHLPFRLDEQRLPVEQRSPSLARLTELALKALGNGEEPFLLLIEGGRIDHACHSFDAAGAAYEVEDFDGAVATVVRFREQNPGVLLLVTADHATGGLAINDYVEWAALRRQRVSVDWMVDQIRHSGAGAEMVREMTGFEDVTEADLDPVRSELDKYEARRNLGRVLAARNGVTWIPYIGLDTKGHTGEDVPIFAAGPQSERFRGVLDNTDIALRLFEISGLGSPPPAGP